jgi:hypothetical protein
MNKNLKTLASASALAFFLFVAYGSDDDKKSTSTTSTTTSTESGGSETAEATATKKIGETLPTEYFEVTVNNVKVKKSVSTGNEFADLKAEPGNKYLIMNTTFKNIDNESRMLMDGEILINYNGKDYTFDKSETVMLEGWGLLLDQINPLTSKTTNIVYKIPEELKGVAYYKPGRAGSKDLIELGNIE